MHNAIFAYKRLESRSNGIYIIYIYIYIIYYIHLHTYTPFLFDFFLISF